MAKTVLVTGGAGYVGSHVAGELVERGDRVIVLDNLTTGHRNLVPTDARFVEADLADRRAIDALLEEEKVDLIMHFAANSLVGDSMRRPFAYLGDNVRNGLNLLESAVSHGVGAFILSSTANLFDKPQEIPISEREPVVPGSPYGESKYILERMLVWAERIHGLRYGCLRYFNAAGAHPDAVRGECHDPETHLIPIVLQVASGQRAHVEIFGDDYPTPDGTCIRDYVHVLDLAQAHLKVADVLAERSVTFNLGNGQGYSVREVIETARRVTGHPIPVHIGPRRPGDPPVLVASAAQIREALGWTPRYPDLTSIIETAWRWQQRNSSRGSSK